MIGSIGIGRRFMAISFQLVYIALERYKKCIGGSSFYDFWSKTGIPLSLVPSPAVRSEDWLESVYGALQRSYPTVSLTSISVVQIQRLLFCIILL